MRLLNQLLHPVRDGSTYFLFVFLSRSSGNLTANVPLESGMALRSLYSGIRRDSIKDLAKSTALVDSLDDVVRRTRLWTKLYAR
jgi:hypothetical protein